MGGEDTRRVRNGGPLSPDRVEIEDTIVVECVSTEATMAEAEQEFEVVGIIEDADSKVRYAVCYCESADEFIVTDDSGLLLRDDVLAQKVLEDFLEQAAQETEEETR